MVSCNMVFVCLVSLSLITAATCSYNYYMDTMCGQTFNFSTLPYPAMRLNLTHNSEYANSMNCTLELSTEIGQHFNIRIDSVDTESCQYDYLLIRESPDPKLCPGSSQIGTLYKTFGNKITLWFHSDGSGVKAGFSLYIEAIVGATNAASGYMEQFCSRTIDFPALSLSSYHLRLAPELDQANNLNCSLLFTTHQLDVFEVRIKSANIEKCDHCLCDWLDIRDGSTMAAPYISGINGKFCGNHPGLTSVHTTTGNVLSLFFLSDKSDGASFDILITSKHTGAVRPTVTTLTTSTASTFLPQSTTSSQSIKDSISVNCNENSWTIGVNMDRLRQLYPDAKPSDIYLGENRCTGRELAGVLSFQQGIEECSPFSRTTSGVNTFLNQLIYAERDPLHPFIIRHYKWTLGVQCVLQTNGSAIGSFQTTTPVPATAPTSQNPVNVSFYLDPNFRQQVSGNPLRSAVGTRVYVKVFTTLSDWGSIMSVRNCYTLPGYNASLAQRYDLIKGGCEVDTNTHIISQSTHEMRFVFDDFEYANSHEGLYMTCDAIFCPASDLSASCRQVCVPSLRRSANIL